ncbi:unnamed protein product, partial [Laminaria digitata]
LWSDATFDALGEQTDEWSNKVELADLDGDGDVDILFANGGDYERAGAPELNRIFLNEGAAFFTEATESIVGEEPDLGRVIKARDVNGDGLLDILVGTVYGNQNRLYLNRGDARFEEVTRTHLPESLDSIGDLEAGDVDGDGDLDLVLADWGEGNPLESDGGRVKLYLNDGEGRFTDATEAMMPARLVQMSWDLEVADLDNDLDLDIIVSCKVCDSNALYLNDGAGNFTDASERLPVFHRADGFSPMDMNRDGTPENNNYDFEVMDIDNDGFLDLLTINDGDIVGEGGIFHRREHILLNDGRGAFVDATSELFMDEANTGFDDNAALFLDYDSDGDADFIIGSLDGADRLLVNTPDGFQLYETLHGTTAVEEGGNSPGTLGIAVADLNGDGRLDMVQSQGELDTPELVFLGTEALAVDTAAPVVELGTARGSARVLARAHDRRSNLLPHHFTSVELIASDSTTTPMSWMGGYLWEARGAIGEGPWQVCATDRAGNSACADSL